jgi:hypothetical protein
MRYTKAFQHKDPLMLFKKLNSLVRDITAKVTTALQLPASAEKIDQLLAARDESAARMLKLERRQGDIGFAGFLGFFPGIGMMIAGATGFLAAPSLAAVTTVLLATPLFTAGLGLAAVSLSTMVAMGKALDRLRADRDIIEKRINTEALKIAQASPEEVKKSPRYLGSLASIYNAAAQNDKSYEKMVARVAPKTAKTTMPAA